MNIIDSSCCVFCGRPLWGLVQEGKICSECKQQRYSFDGATSLLFLHEKERELIHTLKYGQGSFLEDDILYLVEKSLRVRSLLKDALLMPVPLHPSKQRLRGYNQSEMICQWLSKAFSGVDVKSALRRQKRTLSQTNLNKAQRVQNVKNAFDLNEEINLNTDKKWIVVDDVFTTGSTVEACCSILKEKYEKEIYVLTLGHG